MNKLLFLTISLFISQNVMGMNIWPFSLFKSQNGDNICLAAREGNLERVQELLDAGTAVDAKGWFLKTPLHYAANNGHMAIVQLLLDRDATVDVQDKVGNTPLHYAVQNGCTSIAQLLLDRGAVVDSKGWCQLSPLHYAANNGPIAIVQLLLDNGATVDVQDRAGVTPLHEAAENGHIAIVQLLLDNGATVDSKDWFQRTPLDIAANEEVALLLRNWPDRQRADDLAQNSGASSSSSAAEEEAARIAAEEAARIAAALQERTDEINRINSLRPNAYATEILNIIYPAGATSDERTAMTKQAKRAILLKVHPDKVSTDLRAEAHAAFLRANAAAKRLGV